MDKYYTPEIEEFHIGFEYELMKPDSKYYKRIFGKDKIDNFELNEFNDELMKIAHAIIRVKYLDKEDIESLGFEFIQTNKVTYWYEIEFNGNNLPGDSSYKYWKIELLHYPKRNIITIKANVSDGNNYTFFEGIIKTKSELKKLLKQLNIE